MCQAIGLCFVEDPLAEEKDAMYEARWFVKFHPDGTAAELKAHLEERGVTIPLPTLRKWFSEALQSLEREGRGPIRQNDYRKLLELLPAE